MPNLIETIGFSWRRWIFEKIYDDDRVKYSMCKDLGGLLEETFMMPTKSWRK